MLNLCLFTGVVLVHGLVWLWLAATATHTPRPPMTAAPTLQISVLPSARSAPLPLTRAPRAAVAKTTPQLLAVAASESVRPAVPDARAVPPDPSPTLSPHVASTAPAATATGTAVAEGVQSTAPPTPPAASTPRFDAAYLQNPAPIYPPLARRAGEEGRVVLQVYVEPSGLPSTVQVQQSSGAERLDQSAISAVRRWKFIPAARGAESVGAWVRVPIVFSLKG